MKLLQCLMCFVRPGSEVCFFFTIIYVITDQLCPAALFFDIQVNTDTCASGSGHMIDQLLIRTSDDDPTNLVAFLDFVCMYYVINTTAASDKFFLCDHMAFRFQEFCRRLDLQSEISPSVLVYVKGFLNGFPKPKEFR